MISGQLFTHADLIRVGDVEGDAFFEVAQFRTDLHRFLFIRDDRTQNGLSFLEDPLYYAAILILNLELAEDTLRVFFQLKSPDGLFLVEMMVDDEEPYVHLVPVKASFILGFMPQFQNRQDCWVRVNALGDKAQ